MAMSEMISLAVSYSRRMEQKNQIVYKTDERSKQSFLNLDLSLAKLANQIGWYDPRLKNKNDSEKLMSDYCLTLKNFLTYANLQNYNKLINIGELDISKISQTKKDKDLTTVYLIIKKMLYNVYFSHQHNDFLYAFKSFIKLGIVDLGFKWDEIVDHFTKQMQK